MKKKFVCSGCICIQWPSAIRRQGLLTLQLLFVVCYLLFGATPAAAQSWTLATDGAQDRTVVFADLVLDDEAVALGDINSRYRVGAFIDGQCRGLAEVVEGPAAWMQIEVWGNFGNASDLGKTVSFRLYDSVTQAELELGSNPAVVWDSETTYGTPSGGHVVLSGYLNQSDAAIVFPATVTLSRLRDVQLALTHANPGETVVNPYLVELHMADGPHGWTVATATGGGLLWTLRGLAVGEYDYYVTYGGRRMTSSDGTDTGRLLIPAEVSYANGWDWISIYMPTAYPLVNSATGDYLGWLNESADNRIIEIRSWQGAVYNDPQMGLFGDIYSLTPSAGMYKVKSTFDDAHAVSKLLNLGTAADGEALAQQVSMVEPGYTWMAYPHEQAHTLATLQPYLSATATEGDVIIGRDAFLEFDGYQWVGTLTTFEPGKGYIYYTENPVPFHPDWGDYYMPMETRPQAQLQLAPKEGSVWNYNAHQYAQAMPIVATLNALDMEDGWGRDVSVGAFVGDECRGHGEVAQDGQHLFITASGNMGETLTFRLYDRRTDTYTTLDATLPFAMRAGSLKAPVALGSVPDGIAESGKPDGMEKRVYDLLGRRVDGNTAASRAHTRMNIVRMSDGSVRKVVK